MVIKKKKLNKKVVVAIIAALVLGLILWMIMKKTDIKNIELIQEIAKQQKQIKDLTEKQQQQEQLDELKRKEILSGSKNATTDDVKKVIVAKNPISAGTRLSINDLEIKDWPQNSTVTGTFSMPQELIGRITTSDLASGEAVLETKLIDKDMQTLSIPTGCRAMTIPVTGSTGMIGFITPGSRVDLLTVLSKKAGEKDKPSESVSKVIIQNVKVLATSGNQTVGNRQSATSTPTVAVSPTITIAVPVEEVTKVALAYNNGEGNIQVILRDFQDTSKINKTTIDTGELITGILNKIKQSHPIVDLPKPPEAAYSSGANNDLNSILNSKSGGLPSPEMPIPQTKTHTIEVIQANSRQEVSFETEM